MSYQQQHQHMSGNVGQQRGVGVQQQQQQQCNFGLDLNDSVLVLIDHQTGMLNLVRDMDVADLRQNVLALAKAARLAGIPVILTALDEEGPHGQLLKEFDELIPEANFVHRTTEINPWDSQKFVQVLEKTNKKTLIMAGTLANISLASTAIAAACCGFKVFAVLDASGASTKIARNITLHRFMASDVTPIDTLSVITLFMKTFERKDIKQWWCAMSDVLPRYKLLIDTFCKSGSQSQFSSQGDKFLRYKDVSQQQQGGNLQQRGLVDDSSNISSRRYGGNTDRYGDQDVYGKQQQQDVYGKQDIDTGRAQWR